MKRDKPDSRQGQLQAAEHLIRVNRLEQGFSVSPEDILYEEARLSEWLEQSPENREYLANAELAWELGAMLEDDPAIIEIRPYERLVTRVQEIPLANQH